MTKANMCNSESVSASDDDLIPKQGVTSIVKTSNKAQYFARYARKLTAKGKNIKQIHAVE